MGGLTSLVIGGLRTNDSAADCCSSHLSDKMGFAAALCELGVAWAGGVDELPLEPLDATIIVAPVRKLVPTALQAVAKSGSDRF